jgi:hypothetical protein
MEIFRPRRGWRGWRIKSVCLKSSRWFWPLGCKLNVETGSGRLSWQGTRMGSCLLHNDLPARPVPWFLGGAAEKDLPCATDRMGKGKGDVCVAWRAEHAICAGTSSLCRAGWRHPDEGLLVRVLGAYLVYSDVR